MRNNGRVVLAFVFIGLTAIVCEGAAVAADTVRTHKNKKGAVDRWVYEKDGVVYKREYDRNGDGKADLRVIENRGRFVSKEFDNNHDGNFEKTEKPRPHGSTGRIKTVNIENQI